MSRQEAQRRLSDKITIPTPPEIVLRITSMVDDPAVRISDIGQVIAKDPAITAKVLRVANSSFYGLKQPVISLDQAAAVVGGRSLRNIAMQASLMGRYEHLGQKYQFDLPGLWAHSIFTARLCQELGKRLPQACDLGPEELYTCGLLHDVGKAVLLDALGEEYDAVYKTARDTGVAIHVVEERVLSFTHVEVGAVVAQRWQLPAAVSRAIQFHHGPKGEILTTPSIAVVALCDQIAYRMESPDFFSALKPLMALAQETLRLRPDTFVDFVQWATKVRAHGEG
jgi:putative nucleotidyltransferase with HDIG domain